MKIELYFDESIYRKQMELLYNCGYGETQKYYKNSHYLGFGLFVTGVLSIIDNRNFGYALIVFALGILIPYFVFFYKNKKVSKKLVEGQNEVVSIYTQNPKVVLEFSEAEFKYSDYDSERIIAWEDFLTFRIIEENVFLFTKTYDPYVVGKSEAGEENYKQILQIIESKVKK
jgi:hypothetical protein